jgi:predicted transcriptional regulator
MKTTQEQDAEYILEPVAKQLIAAGVSRRKTQTTLRAAARRILRIAAQDAGLPMGLAEKHAGSVVRTLVG